MRQPKTHFTSVQTGADSFGVALDFDAIETLYCKLEEPVRKKVLAIVRNYVWLDEAERNSIIIAEAVSFFDRIISATSRLGRALEGSNGDDMGKREDLISYLASVSLREYGIDVGDHLVAIAKITHTCNVACTEIKHSSLEKGLEKGRAWSNMVGQLLKVAYDFGLPRNISTPNENLKNPSKFVQLVAEIERQLPNVKSPHSTPDARPKAISRIRGELKRKGILGH